LFGMISDGEREEGEKKEKIILKVFEEMNWKLLKWYKKQVGDLKSKLSDSDSDYDSNIETDYDSSRH